MKPINDDYFCAEVRAITIERREEGDTEAELSFMTDSLGLWPAAKVLDVGCGSGRHAIPLARRGYRVTAIDKSAGFVEEGRRRAQEEGLELEWIVGDARHISFKDVFDLAISMYTAFGYHSEEDNLRVLANISEALIPGGRMVLELTNRDAIANTSAEYKVSRTDGLAVIKENTFDPYTSRRRLDWTFLEGDRVVKRVAFDHRVYSVHELLALFERASLLVDGVYEDVSGAQFRPGSRKIVMVGRRAENRD